MTMSRVKVTRSERPAGPMLDRTPRRTPHAPIFGLHPGKPGSILPLGAILCTQLAKLPPSDFQVIPIHRKVGFEDPDRFPWREVADPKPSDRVCKLSPALRPFRPSKPTLVDGLSNQAQGPAPMFWVFDPIKRLAIRASHAQTLPHAQGSAQRPRSALPGSVSID
jgi:hypothetical protein